MIESSTACCGGSKACARSGSSPYETERRTRLGSLLGAITGAPKRPFGHAFAHLPDLEAYVQKTAAG